LNLPYIIFFVNDSCDKEQGLINNDVNSKKQNDDEKCQNRYSSINKICTLFQMIIWVIGKKGVWQTKRINEHQQQQIRKKKKW
jgi:hypothetical protein